MARKRKEVIENGEAPPPETKAEKFRRLGNHRLAAAVGRIKLIGNLGNRAQYSYSAEQANTIVNTLMQAVDAVSHEFTDKAEVASAWTL